MIENEGVHTFEELLTAEVAACHVSNFSISSAFARLFELLSVREQDDPFPRQSRLRCLAVLRWL